MKNLASIYGNKKKLEDVIEEQILVFLNTRGFFWKVDYAGRFIGGKFVANSNKFVLAGMPDVCGVIKGRAVHFEVKTPAEKAKILRNWNKYLLYNGKSKDLLRYQRQIKCILRLRANGAIAEFVSSIDDCVRALKSA